MSIEEEKKAVIRWWIEGINNQTIIDELLSKDYVYHGPSGQEVKGAENFKKMAITAFFPAFPDVNYTIDEMVAEGDIVAMRYTMTATHKGKLMDTPPTGKQITMTGAFFFRLAGGKIIETLGYSDNLSMFQQLGITPPGQ